MNAEEGVVSGMEATLPAYDLGGEHSTETHYYLVQSEVATHSSKGMLKSTDIYLDLETKWVRKLVATLSEETVTSMWGIPVDRSKPVTTLTIRAMSREEFDQD